MEGTEIIEAEHVLGLPPPPFLTVGIAINGKRRSKYVVHWALEKFIPEGKVVFKLLHVRPKITTVPTPSKLLISRIICLKKKETLLANSCLMLIFWHMIVDLNTFERLCALVLKSSQKG